MHQTDRRLAPLLGLAVLTSVFNIVDRSLINILAESIKNDLVLSDTQLGLLTGSAFALFYAVVGLPIARYVDRPGSDRPLVVALCISVWSVMTMLSGAAGSFLQLVAARVFVATGESGSGPALFTLINQSVPPHMRARALGIYGIGPPIGTLIGLVLGGWLVDLVGWRTTFFIVGAPGLLLAFVIKVVLPEPRRTQAGTVAPPAPAPRLGLLQTVRVMIAVPEFVLLAAAFATSGVLLLGMPAFTGVYLIRVLGLKAAQAGLILGLSMGFGGIAGALCGGVLGDSFGRRRPGLSVLSPGIGLLISIPAALVAFGTDDWRVFAGVFWLQAFGLNFYLGPAVTRIQAVVPETCGAMSTFSAFMLMNLVGAGLGPLVIGLGSDLLRPEYGAAGLRWMLIASSVFAVVPATLYSAASRRPALSMAAASGHAA